MARIGSYVKHSDGRVVEHFKDPNRGMTEYRLACGIMSSCLIRHQVPPVAKWCSRCWWNYYYSLLKFDPARLRRRS